MNVGDNTNSGQAPVYVNSVSDMAKKDNTMTYVIAGLVLVGGIFLISNRGSEAPDAEVKDFDEDYLADVLDNDQGQDYLLPDDDSQNAIVIASSVPSEQEVIDQVAAISDRYGSQIEVFANNMQTNVESALTGVVTLFMEMDSGRVTQESLDLYFQVLEIWSARFDSAVQSVTAAVAVATEASIAGINNAAECSETVFMKETYDESTQENTSSYTVDISNGSASALFGIYKSKSSGETRTSVSNSIRNDVRKVSFVPHCIDWQLDATQFAAIMATMTLQTQIQYGILNSVVAMAPDPQAFIKTD